jgi:hypothetical protein
VSVLETALLGTRFLLPIKATDRDVGENGTILSYKLQSNNTPFELVDYPLFLQLNAQLDRELRDSYQLTILAFDGGQPSR